MQISRVIKPLVIPGFLITSHRRKFLEPYSLTSFCVNPQDCEDKLADKEEKIRRLRQENSSNNAGVGAGRGRLGTGGDCRIVGALKKTVEELSEELR